VLLGTNHHANAAALNNANVKLEEDVARLDEVVVTGFGHNSETA
jgi:hypothetical protein